MSFLWEGLLAITWQQAVMYVVGGILIYLAIGKQYEPALLLPMGFGAILVNLPASGVLDQVTQGVGQTHGIIQWLFENGIEISEAFPLLLFIGIGAMIDFGPLLSNPKMFLFGAAAQLGIFLTIILATALQFDIRDAASIGIIGAADGPTSILVSQVLKSRYVGAIAVAAYSYMALVPIIQPFAIKLVTTKKERAMRMPYSPGQVSRRTRILFPIVVSFVAGIVAPASVSLVGFLMFGNLIRECGVLNNLSETAQHELANLVTLLLGITISFSMRAEQFVTKETLLILCLGLFAFVLDSVGGVLFAKLLNLFCKNKVNPMVGAAGISAFPMSARVIEKLGVEADHQNHLLMHAVGANVAGQIASVVAGGVILGFFM
ncbi:sodium ion-translocating decarboxylase subunit beta [Agathobaculum sp. NTUH-O15-33]|uniref:sodium ion-translocating decarboxylase subunit beta n=1 Tax=Agathobaculum sp. NTUH-O15-33 TaxID=3079302 RepID=UPI0029586E54|nr:sodium ion-translocating decarboxylase subunit beta [Agathobaculum sp. NTUH-O15-33]WNX85001.1 sodium ion-translocating decarboxylase subunit beta [Agathobaculum sp. NTUH-O15-33]